MGPTFFKCFLFCYVQAFIIGWTSDLIPKIMYEHDVGNGSLDGYVNYSLSVFQTVEFPPDMRPDTELFNRSYATCRSARCNNVGLGCVGSQHPVYLYTANIRLAVTQGMLLWQPVNLGDVRKRRTVSL